MKIDLSCIFTSSCALYVWSVHRFKHAQFPLALRSTQQRVVGGHLVWRLVQTWFCVLCAGGFFAALPAQAQDEPRGLVIHPASQAEYADTLFRAGEYYRAITEYRRLLYFFPYAQQRAYARIRIVEALILGGEPAQALVALDSLHTHPPAGFTEADLLWLEAVAHLERSQRRVEALDETALASALDALNHIRTPAPKAAAARSFQEDWAGATHAEVLPFLAATLSALMPGAGSAYVGHWDDAALTFLVIGGLAFSAREASREEHHGLRLVLGVGALVMYAGGIYAAANSAQRHNLRLRLEKLNGLRASNGLDLRAQGWIDPYGR